MSMIVQTLSVLETDKELSLEEAIAQKFHVRNSEETSNLSTVEDET